MTHPATAHRNPPRSHTPPPVYTHQNLLPLQGLLSLFSKSLSADLTESVLRTASLLAGVLLTNNVAAFVVLFEDMVTLLEDLRQLGAQLSVQAAAVDSTADGPLCYQVATLGGLDTLLCESGDASTFYCGSFPPPIWLRMYVCVCVCVCVCSVG